MKINIDNFCIDDVFNMLKKLTDKIKKKKGKKDKEEIKTIEDLPKDMYEINI